MVRTFIHVFHICLSLVFGLQNREYSTLYAQKLALTSLTSGGYSVGMVRSRTQATEFLPFFSLITNMFSSYV
jgi:hypothetical protein